MNKHLWQRVESLLRKNNQAVLATCGETEPQASVVHYQIHDFHLYLFVAHTSDHLFNLELNPGLVLLAPQWELHGCGYVVQSAATAPPQAWQVIIRVQPLRIHILNADGSGYAETIDLEDSQGEI